MKEKCPVCGKGFWIEWPTLWGYKRGNRFICSWKCIREYDRKEAGKMKTLTDDEKRAAAEMALKGENPLQYMKGLGVTNVTTGWNTVRNWARGHLNQDEYEKLPERFGKGKPKVELVYDESIAEEYRREQAQKEANARAKLEAEKPEPTIDWIEEAKAEKAKKPEKKILGMEPLEICGVRSRVKNNARFTKDEAGEMFFSSNVMAYRGTWLQFSAQDWKKLSGEILLALEQLKVEV